MYMRNAWYVAAWSREVTDSVVGVKLLDQKIALYRTATGALKALENRCAHRHVPLTLGRVVGDNIQCGYHGLQFNGEGACVHVPAQDRIPERARVRAYPAAERYGWVWLWMGRPEAADPALIPDFHRLSDPAFASTGATNEVAANYELITDNLMDLSHVGFVHGSTIGNAAMGENGKIRVERTDDGVRVTRWVIDCPPPPTYVRSGIFKADDRIDRWQIIDFTPPCFVNIYVGGAPTGTGAPEGRRVGGLGLWIMNAMTPESAARTRYFWAVGRDFAVDNPNVTKLVHADIAAAFAQDKDVLEEQQASIETLTNPPSVDIVADAGGIQARRMLKGLIEREAAPG
ncbi:MAG: vanillate O-demethylase oxygenase [Hyphomicrobiales bacterium]|nr:vanillate O-demethylase oxygenase [Hyphomicrobiales bacterium]